MLKLVAKISKLSAVLLIMNETPTLKKHILQQQIVFFIRRLLFDSTRGKTILNNIYVIARNSRCARDYSRGRLTMNLMEIAHRQIIRFVVVSRFIKSEICERIERSVQSVPINRISTNKFLLFTDEWRRGIWRRTRWS